jgi:hypothetical protein
LQPKITVIKAEGERYKMNFESDCGSITGKVNVTLLAASTNSFFFQERRRAGVGCHAYVLEQHAAEQDAHVVRKWVKVGRKAS